MARRGLLSTGLGGRGFLSQAVAEPERRNGLAPNPAVADILAANRRIAESLLPREERGDGRDDNSGYRLSDIRVERFPSFSEMSGLERGIMAIAPGSMFGTALAKVAGPYGVVGGPPNPTGKFFDAVIAAGREATELNRLDAASRSGAMISSKTGISSRGVTALEGPEATRSTVSQQAATQARRAASADWARREQEAQRGRDEFGGRAGGPADRGGRFGGEARGDPGRIGGR